jgi:hypothetical protein
MSEELLALIPRLHVKEVGVYLLFLSVLIAFPISICPAETPDDPMGVLTPQEWEEVEAAVDRALVWIATQQEPGGRFPTLDIGQPAVTSLCVLAYLARGHLPGKGPYGEAINAGIDFTLSCRKEDGLITYVAPPAVMRLHCPAHTAMYNHAISGIMLSEVYGMTDKEQAPRIRAAVEKAIDFTRARQLAPKGSPEDRGGWRYVRPWPQRDSDLSVTGWQMMFLRSAKNAGFYVPSEYVDQGLEFVERCFVREKNIFVYSLSWDGRHPTRGMVGSGALSLSLAGKHETPMARTAAEWILQHGFDQYNRLPIDPRTGTEEHSRDRYHYGAFYCTQAMFQLGGDYWKRFFPRLAHTLLANQGSDGSWQAEAGEDNRYGNVYTTALVVLVLTTPYQLLPIFQR